LEKTEDQRDVAAALSGDGQAYARIIRRYEQTIARRMLGFTRDRGLVEELTQDVFVQAYLGLAGYRSDAPLEHWLQRIATRAGYAFWKKRGRKKPLPLEAAGHVVVAGPSPPDVPTDEWSQMLDDLPPRDRLVLKMLYVDDLNVAEAADQSGWSQTMIKVQAFRARKKLRSLLEKKGVGALGVR
jgi:RNA polymerase sigma-70 factor (ECF subfamily)